MCSKENSTRLGAGHRETCSSAWSGRGAHGDSDVWQNWGFRAETPASTVGLQCTLCLERDLWKTGGLLITWEAWSLLTPILKVSKTFISLELSILNTFMWILCGAWFWWLNLEKDVEELEQGEKNLDVQSEGKSCLGASWMEFWTLDGEGLPLFSGESFQHKVKYWMT